MANDRQYTLTQDHLLVPSDQTGMPWLMARANLPDEMVDPSGSNAARTDGGDVRSYRNNDQSNRMNIEIVSFEHDSSTAADDAEIQMYVQDDALVISSTADTDIFIEYGDGTLAQPAVGAAFGRNAVWNDSYEGVYHFEEAVNTDAGGYKSATGANDATGVSMALPAIAGQIGTAQDFDGTADYITLPSSVYVGGTAQAFQFWAKNGSLSVDQRALALWAASDANAVILFWMDADGAGDGWRATWRNDASGAFTTGTDSDNNATTDWQKLAATLGSSIRLNIDGAEIASTAFSGTMNNNPSTLRVARFHTNSGSSNFFDGGIDELRISSVEKTADWLETEYANENNPGAFATPGTPGPIGGVILPIFDHHYRMMRAA